MPLTTQKLNNAGDMVSSIQVRSFIAVAFTIALIVGFFMKVVDANVFINLSTVAITWYFTKRQIQEETDSNTTTTTTTDGTTTTTTPNNSGTTTVSS